MLLVLLVVVVVVVQCTLWWSDSSTCSLRAQEEPQPRAWTVYSYPPTRLQLHRTIPVDTYRVPVLIDLFIVDLPRNSYS